MRWSILGHSSLNTLLQMETASPGKWRPHLRMRLRDNSKAGIWAHCESFWKRGGEMKSTVRSKKAAGILVAVIACVVLTGGWASAQQAAGLTAVGGADPANGYPKWYIDGNGLQLAPCLDTTAADPCGLAGAIPDPASPISFPNNFPEEFFYWLLNAKITGIGARGDGTALLANALEGAFGGPTGTPADGAGAQIVFARFRFRVNGGLIGGQTYEMQGPFGRRSFVAAADGTVNFTDDQGCLAAPPACPFNLPLVNTNVGPNDLL